ncbi:hypothetical protein [Micromonospora sp. RV43]|uniref:hypothetical protein n=1 Tax=Micromonospora sp. RV43 TaxID=1661387 RepID=UPI00064BF8A2|nr:hypothetical protein [Micromonospora sp. RV43]
MLDTDTRRGPINYPGPDNDRGEYADMQRAHTAAIGEHANRNAVFQPVTFGYEEPAVEVAGLQTATFADDEGRLVVSVDTQGVMPLADWPNNPEITVRVDLRDVWTSAHRGGIADQLTPEEIEHALAVLANQWLTTRINRLGQVGITDPQRAVAEKVLRLVAKREGLDVG